MMSVRDVVVVGGGAVGVCCAYFLWREGHSVTLVERGDGSDGASHGNAGMLVPSHSVPLAAPGVFGQALRWLFKLDSPLHIRPRFDMELVRWLWCFRASCTEAHVRHSVPVLRDLLLASVDLFRDFIRLDGVEIDLHENGILMPYNTEAGKQHGFEHAEILRSAGLEVDLLDAGPLLELEPALRTPALGAAYFRQDCHVDPSSFVCSLTGYLRERGVEVLSSTEVARLERRGDRIHAVLAHDQQFVARAVILATGAFTQRLAATVGVRVPVQPGKGYSVTLPRGGCGLRIPLLLHELGVTVTPMGSQLRFTGALELVGFDSSIKSRRVASILKQVSAYLPETDTQALVASTDGNQDAVAPALWTGFRPCSPDGLPIIGLAPGLTNLTLATGHGILGLALAPITGKLVAQLVSGESTSIGLDGLDPVRFF